MKKTLTLFIISLICTIFTFSMVYSNDISEKYKSSDIVGSTIYNTTNYYFNDTNLYQTDNFSTYYFNQLNENFGNNIKGSCTYIAFAMLLSYYDTYWDDTLISENYDMITMLSENKLNIFAESPGIYTEGSSLVWSTMSTNDYYQVVEQYSNAHMHLKLIQMGKEEFGQYVFDDPFNPCGLYLFQLQELIDYYLYDFMNLEETQVSYICQTINVRNFIIENIQNGKPVLVRMGSTSISNIGHAFILYDYDEINDELYGHWGWKLTGYDFEHIKLSTTPYDIFWDATVLNINTEHKCSNNYKYSDEYISTETYCPCVHMIHENHKHDVKRWRRYSRIEHRGLCVDCGEYVIRPHVINISEVVNFQAICLECQALLDLRYDIVTSSLRNLKVSINGSYILPSGVIVLVDEDIETYCVGELVFYNKDVILELE